jgi:hypothetical protein
MYSTPKNNANDVSTLTIIVNMRAISSIQKTKWESSKFKQKKNRPKSIKK